MPIPIYSIQDLFISQGNKDILMIKQFDIHRGACYVIEGPMGSGRENEFASGSRRGVWNGARRPNRRWAWKVLRAQ